jgi:hypothetical protein
MGQHLLLIQIIYFISTPFTISLQLSAINNLKINTEISLSYRSITYFPLFLTTSNVGLLSITKTPLSLATSAPTLEGWIVQDLYSVSFARTLLTRTKVKFLFVKLKGFIQFFSWTRVRRPRKRRVLFTTLVKNQTSFETDLFPQLYCHPGGLINPRKERWTYSKRLQYEVWFSVIVFAQNNVNYFIKWHLKSWLLVVLYWHSRRKSDENRFKPTLWLILRPRSRRSRPCHKAAWCYSSYLEYYLVLTCYWRFVI